MEDAGRRVEGEILVGGYSWRKPAGGGSPFDREHVVREGAAEDELFGGCKDFRGCGGSYGAGGGVKAREFGNCFFLGLDALAVGFLVLVWCESSGGFLLAGGFGSAARRNESACHGGIVRRSEDARDEH